MDTADAKLAAVATMDAIAPAAGTCFGLCLNAWQQATLWMLVGAATFAIAMKIRYREAKVLHKKTKTTISKQKIKVKQSAATETLLESGESPCEEPHKPVRVDSARMSRICNDYELKHGLESASLAVLTALIQRRQYNPPSIGVFVGSTHEVADIELAEGCMRFADLLVLADKALAAIRSVERNSQSSQDPAPAEVALAWCKSSSSPGHWSLMPQGESCLAVTGSTPEEEKCFKMLFEACALNPEGDVWQMALYPDAVLKQSSSWGVALKDFRQYRNPSDGRLAAVPNLLQKRVVIPSAEAVAGDGFSFSYQELRSATDAVAQAVEQRMWANGVKKVVLFMGRGKMLAPSFLGVLQAGCTVVPVDVHWPADRAKSVALDSGALLVLTDEFSSSVWANVDAPTLSMLLIEEGLLRTDPTLPADCAYKALDQDDDAIVLFTSGSTGKPKGIVLSHGYLTALVVGVAETKEMTSETRTLSYHSPTWMPFLDYLLAPLLQGGCCLLFPEGASHIVKPKELNTFAQEKKATLLGLVPAVLDIFLDDGLPPSLHTIGVGGAAVTAELCIRTAAAHASRGGKELLLTTGYSGTEQGDVTNIRMRSLEDVQDAADNKRVMGAGRPHAGQRHVIVDRGMGVVGPGAVGEVMVCGPGLATGYLNLSEQTSEYFIPCKALGGARAARTGDLARWSKTGELELVGRLGSMVKVRGARIELGEVEAVIGGHENVKACVVTVHDDKLLAYVEPAVPGDLRDFCKARLVAYMVPHIFEGLEELPRLGNGKVNKKALKPPAPRADGSEVVMELDSLGQMRKFSRKDVAEDIVLDNVRAILIGIVILSHAIPFSLKEGERVMMHGVHEEGTLSALNAEWSSWQYWFLYLLRSGGWSSLAFLSGYDDTRAEHKGYSLTYREVLFSVLWVICGFNWTMWYLPAFVYMRIAFVASSKAGFEYTHMFLLSQMFLTLPAFVDLYIGWTPPAPGQQTICTCFCPFEQWPWAETASKYLIGFWNAGHLHSFLGHGLIFVPCYWLGLYSGKHVFPLLCRLSNEKSWSRRLFVASVMIGIYLVMFTQEDTFAEFYDDRCSQYWNHGSFVWLQVLKNFSYFIFNLTMSLLYVIVIAAIVPVHLKYLAKVSFAALLFSPFAACTLDLPVQALVLRQVLPSMVSPLAEMAWVVAVPFVFELVAGAFFAAVLPLVAKPAMSFWQRFTLKSCLSLLANSQEV